MNWQDLVLDQSVTDGALATLVAMAFGMSTQEVSIVNSVEDFPPRGDKSIVCVKSSLAPDFLMQLSIYLFFKNDLGGTAFPLLEIVKSLCINGNLTCLVPDDSMNPYQFTKVLRDGSTSKVAVDPIALDEEGRYVICS